MNAAPGASYHAGFQSSIEPILHVGGYRYA